MSLFKRATRVHVFLRALDEPKIARQLKPYGFGCTTEEEGRRLLENAIGVDVTFLTREAADGVLEQLDMWARFWCPIIHVSLKRHYPRVHADVFRDLDISAGPRMFRSVELLLDRLRAAIAVDPVVGALLVSRGVNDEVMGEMRRNIEWLDRLGMVPSMPSTEECSGAEEALWAWYREWSTIARVAVRDSAVLGLEAA